MRENNNMGPHMPLYLDRFLGGTMAFGADEIGAYILLIAHQWTYGHVENDEKMIERIARCEYSRLRRVMAKFVKNGDGHLVNPVCDKVRRDREAWLTLQADRGKRGADARWHGGGHSVGHGVGHSGGHSQRHSVGNGHTDTDTDTYNHIPTPEGEEGTHARQGGGQSATNLSTNPPTFQDCVTAASAIGMSEGEIEEFHAYYDSQNWTKGNGRPATNLRSLLQNWKLKGQRFQSNPKNTTGGGSPHVDTRKSRFK